jgi:hypothetical protein
MNSARYFLMTMAGAALLCQSGHAEPAGAGGQGDLAGGLTPVSSAVQKAGRIVGATPAPGGLAKSQPGAGSRRDSAKATVSGIHSLTVRPSAIQPAGPLLTKAPDHGLAPAIIAGEIGSKTRQPAAVSGTGLHHKP